MLTTAALDREIASLKREVDLRIGALEKLVTDRMQVVEERRIEQKQDSKVELDVALTAQKESVAKLEQSWGTGHEQVRQEIADLRRSIDRITERRIGAAEAEGIQRVERTDAVGSNGLLIAAAGAAISLLAILVVVILAVI